MRHFDYCCARRVLLLASLLLTAPNFLATALGEDVPRLTFPTKRFGDMQIMTIGIDGSNPVQVTHETEDATMPKWSPDGSKLVYLLGPREQGKVKICDADGGNDHFLCNGDGPQRAPCFRPDGKHILFSMQSAATGKLNLFEVNADGTGLKNLTKEITYVSSVAPSPDGTKIACSSRRPSGNLSLFILDADGSNPTDLVGRDMAGWVYPCWSPDGKQLVYGYSTGQDNCQLRQINADGTGDAVLVEGVHPFSFAAWSPDGRYLAYAAGPISDGADLSLYDNENGDHRVILPHEIVELPYQDGPPSWVPVRAKQ
jgi:TolB protein